MATVEVADGRFFTEIENQKREMVCVIGGNIAEKFFPHVSALGKEILVDDKPMRVIGVLAKQDNFFMSEDDGAIKTRRSTCPTRRSGRCTRRPRITS